MNIRTGAMAVVAIVVVVAPARAQWTRIEQIPIGNVFNVWTNGDTIVAGSDSTVSMSFDAGGSWFTSAKVAAGVTAVESARIHDGRIYAGTRGEGVFVSGDLGATWQSFNQGLVGGIANSQLFVMGLLLRGDNLYAATDGSGPWVRNLAGAGGWARDGSAIVAGQAGNMLAIGGSPTRLLACGGFNGDVFFRDPGQPDWTESLLFNDRLAAGLAPLAAVWTGHSWLVGTNIGVFHSALGQAPWTYFDFGLHPTLFASFALKDGIVFTHFANGEGTGIEFSTDDGVTWQLLDALPATFTYSIATLGSTLFGGRVDGLWRRAIDTVGVPPPVRPASLRLAIAGPNPVHDEARLRLELPEPGRAHVALFDIAGRRLPGGFDESLSAGVHEVQLPTRDLPHGIYLAQLSAGGRSASVRLVRGR